MARVNPLPRRRAAASTPRCFAMNVGILGAGAVGRALASLIAAGGHDVVVGVRQPDSEPADAVAGRLDTIDAAVAHGAVVILAVPYAACASLLPPLAAALAGKIVVDVTNALQADWSPISLGEDSSAGEEVARLLPSSRVVTAFNTIFADVMSPQGIDRDGQSITAFVASDDDDASAQIANLAGDAGFAPLVVGPLRMARHLEAMAHLNIHLAVALGRGTDGAFLYR
ncbi:MAG: NAD(P)-binding domain-containing protein [Acidobacteriota bacterium]